MRARTVGNPNPDAVKEASDILGKTPGGSVCALEDFSPFVRRRLMANHRSDAQKTLDDLFIGVCRKPPWMWTEDDHALARGRDGSEWNRCARYFADHNAGPVLIGGAVLLLVLLFLVYELFLKE